jgi:hypothetical protein
MTVLNCGVLQVQSAHGTLNTECEWGMWDISLLLHNVHINRTKKPLAIALGGVEWGLQGRYDGGDLTKVQYKPNQKYHYKLPHIMNIS